MSFILLPIAYDKIYLLISAPVTGQYIFVTEADCGARVFLNNEPIIIDRMPPATAKDAMSIKEVQLLPPSEHDGVKEVESKPVLLNGGDKNRIR